MSGLRIDGRRPKEVRRLRCQMGVLPRVDGSAIVEQGNTVVIAVVHGPREARRRGDAELDQGFLTCNVSIAPYASTERRKRKPGDRKLLEASAALQQSFEAAVQLKLYARSQIEIHVQVLQSDGGLIAAAINAASLALVDAGVALFDVVVGCSVAYVQRHALLDPNFTEASSGGPELTIAMLPKSEKLTLTTMDSRLPLEVLESVVALAQSGCTQVHEILRTAILEHTQQRLEARGPVST